MAVITLIAVTLALSGCADNRVICGTEYKPYGLISDNDDRNPGVRYDVVWGIVLSETIIAPIYFFGFSLYEPVGTRSKIAGTSGPDHCPIGS